MFVRLARLILACAFATGCARADEPVGPANGGGFIVSTQQLIRPAGRSVEFHGRPVDLALSPDGKTVFVKSNNQLLVIDTESWQIRQELKFDKGGSSMHGIVITPDSSRLLVTDADNSIREATITPDGTLKWSRKIDLPGTSPRRPSYPCGLALLPSDRAAVCLSMNNTLAIINLTTGQIESEIPVGVAPYDVAISPDGKTACVSNWGGRRATPQDKTAKSAGTDVVIDNHGSSATGTVSLIDLATNKQIAEIATGLHPADVEISRDGKTLYVANACSDTVSVIDIPSRAVKQSISVRPDPALPFGSACNALALSGDEKTLFVANGGNNAVAVVDLASNKTTGFIPTGWYPGGVATDGKNLFIANTKGVGSRDPAAAGKWNSHSYWGSVTRVAIPTASDLPRYTKQVIEDARVPQTLRALEKKQSGVKPFPVPKRAGEPSPIEHVLYIIKENRTYDQLLGDIPRGNGDPKLCIFGKEITPNHHAIAEQFALLDNYYCNGVLSADGHAWATEGVAVDYLEKSFGDWSRSYPFPGDDALAIAPTGFIWDNALLHGLSFRDYGEMHVTRPTPLGTWGEIYADYKAQTNRFAFDYITTIAALKQFSCPTSPGWNLKVCDQLRADIFIKELAAAEQKNDWPNLMVLYLPQDHTSGTNPAVPTPSAMLADNDLAVGRVIDAISHSKFWPKTCIFVIEDDPQAGFDHVDGHRSLCLVASPYTRRGVVVSRFYNQTSVLHTIELMLGLPPMNQFDAMAPPMHDVFTDRADLTPYKCLPNNIPLDQMNPPKSALSGEAIELALQSERLPMEQPDLCDENTLNRIVWFSVKPDAPYPAAFAGAHGKGLKQLHLKLDKNVRDDDDR